MSNNKKRILNHFLEVHKEGTVCTASWLDSIGVSYSLQRKYIQGGWLESMGTGAFKRPHENVEWEGAFYALQYQDKLHLHIGALTALAMQGISHYLRIGNAPVYIFSKPNVILPKWYKDYNWGVSIQHIRTKLFSENSCFTDYESKNFSIKISAPERAIMECLYLAPSRISFEEIWQIMEGLFNIRPAEVQKLLENCNSIKVKRLFLYMAKKAELPFYEYIDTSRVDLGEGKRSIEKGGIYIPEFKIVVPKELER